MRAARSRANYVRSCYEASRLATLPRARLAVTVASFCASLPSTTFGFLSAPRLLPMPSLIFSRSIFASVTQEKLRDVPLYLRVVVNYCLRYSETNLQSSTGVKTKLMYQRMNSHIGDVEIIYDYVKNCILLYRNTLHRMRVIGEISLDA